MIARPTPPPRPDRERGRAAPAAPLLPRPYRILRRQQDTSDTFTLELEPADGAASPAFLPGQFNMLTVYGVGEIPISICSDPAHPELIAHTTRVVGGVTAAMRRLAAGELIGVRGPFGTCWPAAEAAGQSVVIVAGGLGLAPLRPAIYQVLAQRERYGRVVLLYGTRSPADMLYRRELARWRARFDVEAHITVDRAVQPWRGEVGLVTRLIARAPFEPQSTLALVCGPEVMMDAAVRELEQRGVAPRQIFVSLERNMKCAIGLCGHCQLGPLFVCKDGPVFRYDRVKRFFELREV